MTDTDNQEATTDRTSQTTEESAANQSAESAEDANSAETATARNGAFDAVIEAGTLQNTIQAVSVLVDECRLHIEDRHVEISAVDPANVGMIDLRIHASGFESYSGTDETIGINLDRLADVVKMADSGELVSLHLEPETRRLNINFGGVQFSMALIDPDTIRAEPEIPDLELPATVTLDGDDLRRANKAADMVADHVRLVVDAESETFIVKAEGDTDDVHFELSKDDLVDITAADARAIYSLDYLNDLVKPVNSDTAATLLLGEEFPLKLKYELADGNVTITNLLAPRIEAE